MNQKIILLSSLGTGIVGTSAGGAYYLSLDKTVSDKLKRENFQLSSTNDEYEIAFKEFKSSQDYINLIKGSDASLKISSTLQEGAIALKKWCENNLNLILNGNLEKTIKNTKKYCAKPPLTIGEKIKGKRNLITDWSAQLTKLKIPSGNGQLLTDLKTINKELEDLNANNAGEVLQNWCNSKLQTLLNNDKDDRIWNPFESRCLSSIG